MVSDGLSCACFSVVLLQDSTTYIIREGIPLNGYQQSEEICDARDDHPGLELEMSPADDTPPEVIIAGDAKLE